MSLGFLTVLLLLLLRIALYKRPLREFRSHLLFGIALPYLGILSFWSVHMIHAGFDLDRLIGMAKYWDFPLSSFLIFLFFAHIIYRSYRAVKEIKRVERELLSLPHRKFGKVIVLRFERPMAFTLGIFRPNLFLSEGIFKLNREIRKIIISHEMNHIRSFDNLKVLLFSFLIPSKAELSLMKAHVEISNDRKILRKYPKSALINALILSLGAPSPGIGISDEIYLRVENLERCTKGNPLIYFLFVPSLTLLFYLSSVNWKG